MGKFSNIIYENFPDAIILKRKGWKRSFFKSVKNFTGFQSSLLERGDIKF